MNSISPPCQKITPTLGCCPFFEHLPLLGDLERAAISDPDVAALLPRARRLLTGTGDHADTPPWWAT